MPELSCDQFTQVLVDQTPIYADLILEDIRPNDDAWVGHYATAMWPAHKSNEMRLDRFRHVYPNTTKTWSRVQYAGCLGTPCDKTENLIGWGSERKTFFLETQSWHTPLLCFDQLIHVTNSEEQFAQIIRDILRPATLAIMSTFLRKRTLFHSGRKLTCNRNLDTFTYEWTVVGDEEIYFDCSVNPNNVFKLSPQALQRIWNPLMLRGYAGKNPFADTTPFIDLVTDIETCWELDRLGGVTGIGGTPSLAANWRFTEFSAADKFWKYGYSGQVGNFMVRTDPMGLRFNYVGASGAHVDNAANIYRYQVVLPYKNEVTGGAGGDAGLGSVDNPDFQTAQFRLSFVTHKRGLTILTQDMTPINPMMPFLVRDLGGKWLFVMDNLGADVNGCVIENKRHNKGEFLADFELSARPEYTEFLCSFFHRGEPTCIPEINTCNPSPGYPVQIYNSALEPCPPELT